MSYHCNQKAGRKLRCGKCEQPIRCGQPYRLCLRRDPLSLNDTRTRGRERYGYHADCWPYDALGEIRFRKNLRRIAAYACGPACSSRQRQAARRWKQHHCAVCGRQFESTRRDARFCDAVCRQQAHRQRAYRQRYKPTA